MPLAPIRPFPCRHVRGPSRDHLRGLGRGLTRGLCNLSVALWLSLQIGPPASAALVAGNGAPDFSGALVSDTDLPAQGADRFTAPDAPNSAPIVTGLRFWGSYLGGPVPAGDRFTFTLMSSGNIGNLLFVRDYAASEVQRSALPVGQWTHVDALGQVHAVPVYQYDMPAAFALVSNLDYYVSFTHHSEGDNADWSWAFSVGGDDASLWRHHQAWWADRTSDFAYELLGPVGAPEGTVDEPAAIGLAALGLMAMAGRRRGLWRVAVR